MTSTLAGYLLRRHRRPVALLLTVTLFVSLLEGVGAGLLIPIIESIGDDGVGTGHWFSRNVAAVFAAIGVPFTLVTILIAGFLLFAVQQLLAAWRYRLSAETRARVVVDLRAGAFANVLEADLSYLDRQRAGQLVNGVIIESDRAGAAIAALSETLVLGAVMAMYLIVALFISWPLTLLAVSLLGVLSLAVRRDQGRAGGIGRQVTEANNALHAAAMEYLGGVRVIKAFGRESVSAGTFAQSAREGQRLMVAHAKDHARIGFVYEVTLFGALVTIVYLAISYLSLGPALLSAFLFILYRLSPRAVAINRHRHQIAAHLPAFTEVTRLIDETRASRLTSGNTPFHRLERGIEFQRVSFEYESDQPVMQEVRLFIERGRTTGFVGGSGAGKTTMIDLLLRLYDPTQGCILVDGVDLRTLDLARWRRAIGVVHQDTFLFNDTIWNNILVGAPEADAPQVMEAARLAHVHEFAMLLPNGYHSLVGDRGVRLSGGQRQRLALARAFLRQPEILILDEPTSALDAETDAAIQESLAHYRRDRTVIVVAHRLATIQLADKVYVLEDGRVIEEGDPDTLLRQGQRYARFHQLQMGGRNAPGL